MGENININRLISEKLDLDSNKNDQLTYENFQFYVKCVLEIIDKLFKDEPVEKRNQYIYEYIEELFKNSENSKKIFIEKDSLDDYEIIENSENSEENLQDISDENHKFLLKMVPSTILLIRTLKRVPEEIPKPPSLMTKIFKFLDNLKTSCFMCLSVRKKSHKKM